MRKIPLSFAKVILKIIENSETGGVRGGEIKDKKVLLEFVSHRLITEKRETKTRKSYTVTNLLALQSYLLSVYGIKDIKKYVETMQDKDASRGNMLESSTRDKEKQIGTQTGIYLKSTFALEIYQGISVPANADIDGLSYFLTDYTQIVLDKDICIIGVENSENLMKISSQIHLFSGYGSRLLFMLVNPSMLNLLPGTDNKYVHYGDFDYAGISIYLHKIKTKLKGKSEFFVPDNIGQLLKDGDSTKYFQHKHLEKSITGSEEKIDMLIESIRSLQKTAYQEALIIKKQPVKR
ncbi:hypothetical protein TSL6_02310 [Sulfurovum sp. TSL6]|uniref:hypothetical protein n=1 Tax=Sulfurovum sp. TSL6 TaxID=2826995 RepID=UPI001CC48407|nr:hypothetical protein [Sulfurovum sp. TSL6]GIT99724.1 hypothetical protein TSL6_02310 [Sulfurovum sp. TSL6]